MAQIIERRNFFLHQQIDNQKNYACRKIAQRRKIKWWEISDANFNAKKCCSPNKADSSKA